MARQVGMEITGTIENIIFYKRQGKFLLRTVQRQAEASKKAAKNFGQGATKAKLLRQLLLPFLPNPKDRDMQNRLTPAMRQLLVLLTEHKAIQPANNPLAGLSFTPDSNLKDCLLFPWTITQQSDGNIRMQLPALNPIDAIVAPPGSTRVELQAMAVAFRMDDDQTFAGSHEILMIPYIDEMQPERTVILGMQAETGSLVVVTVALSYWNGDQRISKEGFMPVEIVAAFKNSGD